VRRSNESAEHVIEPGRNGSFVDPAELWRARELLYLLVWRDLKVRYKQTLLGVAWIVLQAVLATAVFTLFFGGVARPASSSLPYPVFALAGVVPWLLFAYGVTGGTVSLVANEQLVRRVWFPRYLIPLGTVLAGLVDGAIGLVLLIGAALVYGVAPAATWLALPLIMLLCAVTTVAIAEVLAVLNVRFRDVQHVVPFFTQILFFLSPIVYSSDVFAPPWRTLYALNPLVGVIRSMRWALAGDAPLPLLDLTLTIAVTLTVLVLGGRYFRSVERKLADII
jgi:lipopolysaccharide transport system permease protein